MLLPSRLMSAFHLQPCVMNALAEFSLPTCRWGPLDTFPHHPEAMTHLFLCPTFQPLNSLEAWTALSSSHKQHNLHCNQTLASAY